MAIIIALFYCNICPYRNLISSWKRYNLLYTKWHMIVFFYIFYNCKFYIFLNNSNLRNNNSNFRNLSNCFLTKIMCSTLSNFFAQCLYLFTKYIKIHTYLKIFSPFMSQSCNPYCYFHKINPKLLLFFIQIYKMVGHEIIFLVDYFNFQTFENSSYNFRIDLLAIRNFLKIKMLYYVISSHVLH